MHDKWEESLKEMANGPVNEFGRYSDDAYFLGRILAKGFLLLVHTLKESFPRPEAEIAKPTAKKNKWTK